MKTKVMVSAAIVVVIVAIVMLRTSGPSNYNECIEMNISKASTRESSLIVNQMCKKRFPTKYTEEDVFGR